MLFDEKGEPIPPEHISLNVPVDDNVVHQVESLFEGALLVFRQQGRREPFFVKDILGGVNHEWSGIAPIELYNAYMDIHHNDQEAFKEAGMAAGRIFMLVLIRSEHQYRLDGYFVNERGKPCARYSQLD